MTAYVQLPELKASNPSTDWGVAYDATLTLLLETASALADEATKRHAGAYAATSSVRWLNGNGKQCLLVPEMAGAPTVVSVALGGVVDNGAGTGGVYTALTANDYWLVPDNGVAMGVPYDAIELSTDSSIGAWEYGRRTVKITAPFGYSTTPPRLIKQAVIIQAVRWWKRGEQAFRDTSANVELGQLMYTKALDPDVIALLDELRPVMGR